MEKFRISLPEGGFQSFDLKISKEKMQEINAVTDEMIKQDIARDTAADSSPRAAARKIVKESGLCA